MIGRELRDQQYQSSLGAGVNLMREPRNGRNFEYLGEDPILAGKMVAQLLKGLQSQKVIGDVKHYAFNDQETGRNIGNVRLSKRIMRETDLLAFEIAVLEGQPGMVMCSYNKVNGDWACENDYLLNQLLKKTWGFKGVVVSDWNATHSTAKAAMAGLDCEQPGGPPERARFGDAMKKAVEAGEVPMSRIDDMVRRIVRTAFAAGVIDEPPLGRVVDPFKGADSAQKIAEQSSVLLKNANNLLPLDAVRVKSIAIIGSKADTSVLSGGGSAQVDPPGGGPSRFGGPAVWFPELALEGRPREGAEGQGRVSRWCGPAGGGGLGEGIRRGDRVRQRADQRRSRYAHAEPVGEAERTGERGRESAYDRGSGNRRSGGHALDRQRRRGDRDWYPGIRARRRGQHPVRRRQPVREAAGQRSRSPMPIYLTP